MHKQKLRILMWKLFKAVVTKRFRESFKWAVILSSFSYTISSLTNVFDPICLSDFYHQNFDAIANAKSLTYISMAATKYRLSKFKIVHKNENDILIMWMWDGWCIFYNNYTTLRLSIWNELDIMHHLIIIQLVKKKKQNLKNELNFLIL